MPYGVPKSKGGDTPDNTARMDRCVQHLQTQGHSKLSSIRICKKTLFGSKKPLKRKR